MNRKIIPVDGTFLSGPNKRILLVAVAQDNQNELLLLAYAILNPKTLNLGTFSFQI